MDANEAGKVAKASTFSGNIFDRYRINSVLRAIRREAKKGYLTKSFDLWLWFGIGDPSIVERHLKSLGYSVWGQGGGLMHVSWEKYGTN